MRSVLEDFVATVDTERVDAISDDHCRRYARDLHQRVNQKEIANSTAHKNYGTLRAFLSWCVEERLLGTNPADSSRATAELPPEPSGSDTQYWHPADREHFLRFVDRRNDRAQAGEITVGAYTAQRDQVLVYLIALTGVRGAEVFRVPDDDERDGLRWVDIDEGVFEVLGKTRKIEQVGWTGPEYDRLCRWRKRLEPTDDWPVFPTLSQRTLHRPDYGVGDELEATGYDRDNDQHPIEACAEFGIVPPALSLQAARNVVTDLSQAAGLPEQTDTDRNHLTLHGARRGLGGELYDVDPVEAQRTLRHKSIETTFKSYAEKEAEESGQRRADILGKNKSDTDH